MDVDTTARLKFKKSVEPFSMCMICLARVRSEVADCPRCEVPVAHVRKCPSCSRIMSSRHPKCVYCGQSFLQPEMMPDSPPILSLPVLPSRTRIKARRALVVSIAVFTLVFAMVLTFTRQLEKRKSQPTSTRPIATSYAMRRTLVFETPRLTGSAGQLPAGTQIEIIEYEVPIWWQVKTSTLAGYAKPRDFAPPKVLDSDRGYLLLREYIVGITDSRTMATGIDAVQDYGSRFPASEHSDELLFWTAEQARLVAEQRKDEELLGRARKLFTQLTMSARFGEGARAELESLPSPPIPHSSRDRQGSNPTPSRSVTQKSLTVDASQKVR